jgi:transposase
METHSKTSSEVRYLAIDLHKHYVVIGGVNNRQEVVMQPRRVEVCDLESWCRKNLLPSDEVVLEATTNAWVAYDLIAPLVKRCVVASPLHVRWIAEARVKTDATDVIRLAKLLAANLVPEVWVPPVPVRELRALMAYRQRVVNVQVMTKNRLQSVLHGHHLEPPTGNPFADKNRDWWLALPVSETQRLRIRHDLDTLQHLQSQLADLENEIRRLSTTVSPWKELAPYLIQLPGFGLITAMTILAAIGDITRFPSSKELVGYAGLGAGVHDSGQTHRDQGITKQGRRDLRQALIEAAWIAVNHHPFWQAQFQRLLRRKPKGKAIVAIARRLLIAIFHVLSERAADKNAIPEMVAFKIMSWSWKLTDEQRSGLSTRQFIRYHLMRLKLGYPLPFFITGKATKHLIASPEEVLALKPELSLVS